MLLPVAYVLSVRSPWVVAHVVAYATTDPETS